MMYVMAILGCGDAGDMCREMRVEPVRYTSIQACQAASATMLARHTDLDFPEIATKCRSATAQVAAASLKPRG